MELTKKEQVIKDLHEVYNQLISIDCDIAIINEREKFNCYTCSELDIIKSMYARVGIMKAKLNP